MEPRDREMLTRATNRDPVLVRITDPGGRERWIRATLVAWPVPGVSSGRLSGSKARVEFSTGSRRTVPKTDVEVPASWT